MRTFGLIGFPLSHSFSEKYFIEKFKRENISDTRYQNFPLENIDLLPGLIDNKPDLMGFNVTIPYKEKIFKYLDNVDQTAAEIGAVNTVLVQNEKNKKILTGFNTDVYGFYHTIKPMLPGKKGNALILGTGGASKAVAYVLKHLQINFRYVSRKPADNTVLSYDEISAHIMKNFTILINTTPLGTFPDIMHVPSIPYQEITENHILIDLIYNPDKTQFLQNGENKGAKISNGLKMLKLQAEQAWKIWNHLPINSDI